MSELHWVARRGQCAIDLTLGGDGLVVTVARGSLVVRSAAPLRLLTAEGTDLLAGLTLVGTREREVVESYQLAVGKRIGAHEVRHAERTVELARPDGGAVTIVLRAAEDGVALRLVVGGAAGTRVLGDDLDLALPETAAVWPLRYTPWYEEPRFSATVGTLPDGDYGLPLLVQPDPSDEAGYLLVAESDVDGRYGGSFLRHAGGTFAFTLADQVDLGDDSVATPWRVFILGGLAQVVASHLVEDLAPAAQAPAPAWVRPGRAAWSWWSDFYSGAQLDAQLRLVDYAAEHGWEHVLVDCGWDRAWLPDLVAAASARGVGVFVWVSWDWLDIHTDLAEWAAWGVAGIKVDFMESESQDRYRWYDKVIAEAGRVGLMVNFHGSVIPRGWARTYPHVVTYEAVRGAEYYVFYSEPLPPEHNTIVPFTRNVVGSADYTPVTFSTDVRTTSDAHELALAIVLESGITHFADEVSQYQARPLAQEVLDRVVSAWDETRLLGGRPGEWAAVARRHGAEWFVGVVSAGPPRTVTFALPEPLASGVRVVLDGPDGGLVAHEVTPEGGTVRLELTTDGGAVLLAPGPARAARPRVATRAPLPARDLVVAEPGTSVRVAVEDDGAEVEIATPPGWPAAVPAGPGAWDVTVPDDAPPAHALVVTVRRTDPTRTSAVAHVRVAAEPAVGTTDLVGARPVVARNGFGPVERDRSNGGGNPFDGEPLTVAGTVHEHGLGVCAPAEVCYALGGFAERFTALVGIDDETPGTSATVEVRGDTTTLVRLELRAGQPVQPVDVDVRGLERLALVVHSSRSTPAHVDWVDPTLHRSPPTGRTPQ